MLRRLLAHIDPRERLGRRAYWRDMLIAWTLILGAGIAGGFLGRSSFGLLLLVLLWISPWAAFRTMRRLRDAGGWPLLVPLFWACFAMALFAGWVWAITAAGGLEPGPGLTAAAGGLLASSGLLATGIIARAARPSRAPSLP